VKSTHQAPQTDPKPFFNTIEIIPPYHLAKWWISWANVATSSWISWTNVQRTGNVTPLNYYWGRRKGLWSFFFSKTGGGPFGWPSALNTSCKYGGANFEQNCASVSNKIALYKFRTKLRSIKFRTKLRSINFEQNCASNCKNMADKFVN
jgi:hypothetical protein